MFKLTGRARRKERASALAGTSAAGNKPLTPTPLSFVLFSGTPPRLENFVKKMCIRLRLIHRIHTKPSLWCRLMCALTVPSYSVACSYHAVTVIATACRLNSANLQGCRRAAEVLLNKRLS